MKGNKGFTLMELMIAIAIVMILAGVTVARLGSGTEKAKIGKATAELSEIVAAARSFYGDTGVWPEGPKALVDSATSTGYDEFGAQGKPFEEGGKWSGPYLEIKIQGAAPTDPWKNPYTFTKSDNALYAECSHQVNGQSIRVLIHRFST